MTENQLVPLGHSGATTAGQKRAKRAAGLLDQPLHLPIYGDKRIKSDLKLLLRLVARQLTSTCTLLRSASAAALLLGACSWVAEGGCCCILLHHQRCVSSTQKRTKTLSSTEM